MSRIFEAKYTKLLKDVIDEEPTIFDNISFTNPTYTKGLKDALINRFYIYEICSPDIAEFKELLDNTFNLNKEYFEKTLDKYLENLDESLGYAYHKEYTLNKDFDSEININNEVSNTENSNYASQVSNTEDVSDATTNTNIELPNRTTQSEYPNNKNTTDYTSDVESTSNRNDAVSKTAGSTLDGNNTQNDTTNETFEEDRTGGINVIDQRERMLKYIRNIYYEFTEKFKSLFIFVYD